MKLLLSFNQIILETFSSVFIIAICSSLSIFTNSKFVSFGFVLFCFVLFGNDSVFYCLFYILICLLFICLALNPPNLQKYMNPHLISISDILIRVLSIVFTSDLRLVFKPYLTRIGPVQS